LLVRQRIEFEAGRLEPWVEPEEQPVQQLRRLSVDEISDLVAGYRDGQTVFQLGSRFGINRKTVGAILKRQGVSTSKGVPQEDWPELSRLRAEGWKLRALAERFSVEADTVSRTLRRCATLAAG
jgi:DNA-binding MarR family transcriptional regulator